MFTGVELSNGYGGLLVQADIKRILEKKHSSPEHLTNQGFEYWPTVTAMYQENYQDEIIVEQGVAVLASDTCGEHPEQRLIEKDTEELRLVRSIGLNYSPCTDSCADDIIERYSREGEVLPKPVIHFSRVYKYNSSDRSADGMIGVMHLIENGFKLQVWETKKMYKYLLQQAPTSVLREELQQAYENTTDALSQRDEKTQEHIEEAQEKVDKAHDRRENLKRTAPEEATQKRAFKR